MQRRRNAVGPGPATASLLSLATLLSGCAIRPVPENVTTHRENTYDIAMRIRCETRAAVYKQLVDFMDDSDNKVHSEVAKRFRAGGPAMVWDGSYAGVPKPLMDELHKYVNTAIIYDFRFDMAIQNNLGGGIGLGDSFLNRTLTGDISAKNNLKRSNIRIFRLTDTLPTLFHPHMQEYCDAEPKPGEKRKFRMDSDHEYPIVGKLDVYEIVHTFWRFDRDDLLRIGKELDSSKQFADQIEFRTELESTIAPTVATTDPSQVFRIVKVYASLVNNRTDTHAVIIGIATSDPAPTQTAAAAPAKKAGKASSTGDPKATTRRGQQSALERLASPEATAKAIEDANRAVDRLILREDSFRLGNRLDRLDDLMR